MSTFAQLMLNSKLPSDYQLVGNADKSMVYKSLTGMAKDYPDEYSDYVQHVKQVGDFFSTNEGITVGLEDIEPNYKARDLIISSARKDLGKLQTLEARQSRLLRAQNEGIDLAKKHPGSLTKMTLSGGRGSYGQLVKTLVSPITVKGPDDTPTDFLMTRSYSEGVKPAEFWMGASEARREAARGNLATALPGDSAKQLTNTLNKVVINAKDCGTKNGILMDANDSNILGRYTAGNNVLVTESYLLELTRKRISKVKVRSPMTCEAQPGVCQMCYGLDAHSKHLDIGTNYGIRVAQALSEPLTQMVLSSKHGGNMAKLDDSLPSGMEGFRQIMDIPKVFKNEATLATLEGRVNNIEKLPHGGFNVFIGVTKHFVSPGRKLLVTRGAYVGKGEALTDGVPNPKSVTDLRGLGSGRKYLLDTLHGVYQDSGVNMDKRHLETLVREDLNYVKASKSDPDGQFLKHDIVPYNQIRPIILKSAKKELFGKKLLGQTLGEDYLHFTAGTEITPEVYSAIENDKPKQLAVSPDAPAYKPIMTSLERVPTMSKDIIGRLGHRRLKDTIIEGANKGYSSSKIDSPLTDYIFGLF